jgi:adenosylhomocysteine nucleosidase
MIGVTFALPSESSDLRRRLLAIRKDHDLLFGKIDDRDVAIAHTGVGEKHCQARLEFLLHTARPRLVISSGLAGAVTNELRSGNLVLAQNFSDQQLLARASEIVRGSRTVKLFTASTIVDSIEERNKIALQSGAAAVDMETGAIANVCSAHGVPFLSLRAISDSPVEPFPAPMSVLFDVEHQRTSVGRLLAYLFRDPGAGWRIVRFGKQIARVRANLTDAIVALVKVL